MNLKNICGSRLVTVTAGAAVIGVLGTGAGYAAATINSADIVNDSVRSIDIMDETIRVADLAPGARESLRGETGPRGLRGAQGEPGPAGDSSIVPVTDLNGLWTVRSIDRAGATLTGDGAQFGPFEDDGRCDVAGRDYARLDFSGLNGEPLSALHNLTYRAQHVADTDTEGYGAIPLRVFYDDPTNDDTDPTTDDIDRITFSPNTQFNKPSNYGVSQGTVNEYLVTSGTARVNDDAGSAPGGERPFSEIVDDFGDLDIVGMNFLGGCSGADTTNLRQIVTEVEVNGTTYAFGTEG